SRSCASDRDIVARAPLAPTAEEGRDAVRSSQAHSQARPLVITRTERCAGRVHPTSHRPEPSQARETHSDADPENGLGQIGTTPVEFRSDTAVLPAMAQYMLSHCNTAEVSLYEGVGHAPFLEDRCASTLS